MIDMTFLFEVLALFMVVAILLYKPKYKHTTMKTKDRKIIRYGRGVFGAFKEDVLASQNFKDARAHTKSLREKSR